LRLNVFELLKRDSNIASLLRDFPISERVEIGLFIEQELHGRQGERTDLELPHNYAEVKSGTETRSLAAKISDFVSHFTYSQAKTVVKQAIPAVIRAMDAKVLSVSKAKQIAILPKKEQILFIERMNKKVKP
jgi:ectoine hydroxylase-related dioxygenase (phytanoyl-CoA dioxygenase family)